MSNAPTLRLPREFSCIVVGLVYHPPQADNNELHDHLVTSLDKILASHQTAGVMDLPLLDKLLNSEN